MFHGSGNAVRFVIVGHIVRLLPDGRCGIAHRNTDSGSFNDGKVVFRVADCHRFCRIDGQNLGKCTQSYAFVDAGTCKFQIVVSSADAGYVWIGFQIIFDFRAILKDTILVRIEVERHLLDFQMVVPDELRKIIHAFSRV